MPVGVGRGEAGRGTGTHAVGTRQVSQRPRPRVEPRFERTFQAEVNERVRHGQREPA